MNRIDIERIVTVRMVPESPRSLRNIVVGNMRGIEWDYFLYRNQLDGFKPVPAVHLTFSMVFFFLISVQN